MNEVEIISIAENGDTIFKYNGIKLFIRDCLIPEMDAEEFEWNLNMCRNGFGDELGVRII